MIKNLKNFYTYNIVSRWFILAYDLITICLAFILTYLLVFNFDYTLLFTYKFIIQNLIIATAYLISFFITKSYCGIIRHTSLSDVLKILKTVSLALLFIIFFNLVLSLSEKYQQISITPCTIIIIHTILSLIVLIATRVLIKLLYLQIFRECSIKKISVLVYGAGESGILTKNALVKDNINNYNVAAYIDDNPTKINKHLEGIPVLKFNKALNTTYIKENDIKELIISIQNLHPEKKNIIIEKCLELNLHVKVVPTINTWINGQLSSKQLRNVKIEELLERETIKLDNKNISHEIDNKVIMVTGAAGSIGSEIVRQILNYSPKRLIIVDQAESPVFDLQFEIKSSKVFNKYLSKIEFVIANVKDKFRMENVFKQYRPDIIYHAAAYKHVPLMEDNPYEALLVNVFGTKNIADLSIKYNVEKFVMISTDKAVNPTNIMGASKRIAEIYIQSLADKKTKFITTRFGNVLGSNGSVVPLFRKQIEAGGPLTITHKDITRYFMTIPEACNLVLEAGAIGNGSDIFIFDMGQPVKIFDMAKKMIRLFGYEPDKDIMIKEIGLRPGEKLYEELLNVKENTIPTHNPKIMRAKVCALPNESINNFLNQLSKLIFENNDYHLVAKMKEIVPEYISNNSVYEKLDKKYK